MDVFLLEVLLSDLTASSNAAIYSAALRMVVALGVRR